MKTHFVRQLIQALRPAAAAAVCLTGLVPVASAQPLVLTEDDAVRRALGTGMHAFFGSDYQQAYDNLTEVVAAGSNDPRALYFRGLAARRMGRIDEAEADFSEAARLEAAAIGQWPVSQTLERVQGSDRLALERHRIRGRIARIQAGREADLRRYSGRGMREDSYLRDRRPAKRDPKEPFEDRAEDVKTPAPVTSNQPAGSAGETETSSESESKDSKDQPQGDGDAASGNVPDKVTPASEETDSSEAAEGERASSVAEVEGNETPEK